MRWKRPHATAFGRRMLVAVAVAIGWCSIALAQYPAPPARSSASSSKKTEKKGDTEAHEKELEDRLKRMETVNSRILQQMEMLTRQNQELARRLSISSAYNSLPPNFVGPPLPPPELLGPPPTPPGSVLGGAASGTMGNRAGPGAAYSSVGGNVPPPGAPMEEGGAGPDSSVPAGEGTPEGPGASGTIGNRPDREAERKRVRVDFGDGLEFTTPDDEFQLKFHDLTQAEIRMFDHTGSLLHDNFFVPRQRWYFLGRVSKHIEFYTVINRGYGSLDLLDAFIDLIINEHAQLRVGRMKTPYTYEYWKISEGDLIAPERSLFVGNFAPNRELGMMGHGRFLDQRLEYAIGVFNGPRRSFEDFNNGKDLFLFLNTKPFLKWEDVPLLQQLNLGGSYNFGSQLNPVQPNALRTANDQTPNAAADTLSPTFMRFNNNVMENGMRSQYSADLAWYYKSFNILAGYQGGFQDYAITDKTFKTRVPLQGFEATAYWFVTGERITRRVNVVEPLRPFGFRDGRLQPGAIEIFTRYSTINVGKDVFSSGLVDRNLWTNQAYAFDTGINWYLSHYMKIYLDWQHSEFGDPVALAPSKFSRTMNLYWLRFQLFF